jgi:hypothetical protein
VVHHQNESPCHVSFFHELVLKKPCLYCCTGMLWECEARACRASYRIEVGGCVYRVTYSRFAVDGVGSFVG